MKTILTFALLLITSLAHSADFTITVQGGGQTGYKFKGDGVILGPSSAEFQPHVTIDGRNWLLNVTPQNLDANGYGDYGSAAGTCFFQSSDCSGTCLLPPGGGTPYVIEKAVVLFGGYTRVLEMTENTLVSDSLSINSCMNAYENVCRTSFGGCGGSSTIIASGNLLKNNIVFKLGNMELKANSLILPAHQFRFKRLELVK